eukprot:scaffold5039_cov255-Pinguiococcus_pyrenoidosus.AAC.12
MSTSSTCSADMGSMGLSLSLPLSQLLFSMRVTEGFSDSVSELPDVAFTFSIAERREREGEIEGERSVQVGEPPESVEAMHVAKHRRLESEARIEHVGLVSLATKTLPVLSAQAASLLRHTFTAKLLLPPLDSPNLLERRSGGDCRVSTVAYSTLHLSATLFFPSPRLQASYIRFRSHARTSSSTASQPLFARKGKVR